MKLHYYPDTDSLYIELRAAAAMETREIAAGLNADFDADGNIVGLDIDGASGKLDLTTLEAIALTRHHANRSSFPTAPVSTDRPYPAWR